MRASTLSYLILSVADSALAFHDPASPWRALTKPLLMPALGARLTRTSARRSRRTCDAPALEADSCAPDGPEDADVAPVTPPAVGPEPTDAVPAVEPEDPDAGPAAHVPVEEVVREGASDAVRPVKESTRRLLRTAVFCSGWGDVFLMREDVTSFKAGLGAFGAAHLGYAAAFVDDGALTRLDRHPVLAGLGAAGGYTFTAALAGQAGPLRPPALAYGAALTTMAVLGVATGRRWVGPGVVLFLLSDSMLAAQKFLALRGRAVGGLVMATYTLGQGLIVHGYTRAM